MKMTMPRRITLIVCVVVFVLIHFSVVAADVWTAEEKARSFIAHMNSKSYKNAARLFGHTYDTSSKEYKERLAVTIDELTVIRRTFGRVTEIKPSNVPNYKLQVTGVSLADPEYVTTTLPNKQIVFEGVSARKDKVFISFQFKTEGKRNKLLLVLISYH